MKNLTITVMTLFFLLSIPLWSQDFAMDKGSLNIAGTITFESRGGDLYEVYDADLRERRVSVYTINPSFLYFVMPNLGIGAEILYDNVSMVDESLSIFSFGPRAAYFFGSEGSSSYPYLGGGISYANVGSDGTITMNRILYPEGSMIRIIPFMGVVFMFSKNVGMNIEVYAKIDSFKAGGGDQSYQGDTVGLRVGFSGFLY